MRNILFFLFILVAYISNTFAQEVKMLKGFVKNKEMQTLSFAIIYNVNTKQTFSANEFGAFVIYVKVNDTLVISRWSYKTDTAIITKADYYEAKPFTIFLKRNDINLKDVRVNYRHRYDSMAKAMAELMKHDTLLNNHERRENVKEMAKLKLISTGGIGVEGLIYKAWYKYSTEGKNNEKLLKMVQLYNQSVLLDDKLSIAYIMNITGVDEKKANYIKLYCAKAKLLKTPNYNDYDLLVALKECALE
jgi:hypothetical protein